MLPLSTTLWILWWLQTKVSDSPHSFLLRFRRAAVWQLSLPDPGVSMCASFPCPHLLSVLQAAEGRIGPSAFVAVGLLTAVEEIASCIPCSSSPAWATSCILLKRTQDRPQGGVPGMSTRRYQELSSFLLFFCRCTCPPGSPMVYSGCSLAEFSGLSAMVLFGFS